MTNTGNGNALTKIICFIIGSGIIGGIYGAYWYNNLRWHEETEDAYVNGYQNIITSQVSGNVVKLLVDDTQDVKKGQLLAIIDDTDYKIQLKIAESNLAKAVRSYYSLNNKTLSLLDQLNLNKTDFNKVNEDYKRNSIAYKKELISKEEYENYKNIYEKAKYSLQIAEKNYLDSKQQSYSSDIKSHPDIQRYISDYKNAYFNLKRTHIYSPIDGVVAKKSVFIGQKINSNQNILSVINLDNIWVDANLKETQLKNIKLGQTVNIKSDINGKEYKGLVEGISAGSGSAFSLLPAQNATGNWIKVVQRVPVKISVEKESMLKNGRIPLGSSVVVDINTSSSIKLLHIDNKQETNIFYLDDNEVMENVSKIIQKNSIIK